jgi:hypothetical protein
MDSLEWCNEGTCSGGRFWWRQLCSTQHLQLILEECWFNHRKHDLLASHEKYPGLNSWCYNLEDLEPFTKNLENLYPMIERVVYKFFTEQPVEGTAVITNSCIAKRYTDALVYALHSVLHDWLHKMCLGIQQHLKKNMKLCYSKLVIHERTIPETGSSMFHSMLDITIVVLWLLLAG